VLPTFEVFIKEDFFLVFAVVAIERSDSLVEGFQLA
jgi:hypothetical protein